MKEWSDKELDELFRKSAEEFEPTYQTEDWQDLRRRLDEANGVTGSGGWLKSSAPWLAGVLLLLLGGFGAYYYNSEANDVQRSNDKTVLSADGTPNVEASAIGTSAADAPTDGVPAAQKPVSSQAAPGRSGTENAARSEEVTAGTFDEGETGEAAKNEAPNQKKEVRKEVKAQKFAAAPEVAPKVKELPRNPASVSGVRKPTDPDGKRGEGAILLSEKAATPKIGENSGGNEIKSTPFGQKSVIAENEANSGRRTSTEMPQRILLEKPPVSSLRDEWPALSELASRGIVRESDGPSYPAINYKFPEKVRTAALKKAAARVPLWSVRIGISPDLSMVRVSEMMKSMRPGPSASLLVDYNIRLADYNTSAHLAIQTGVIRSLKTYSAQFEDYNGSEEWGNDPMPTNIDGDAQVFEIPLNLRYDLGYALSPRQNSLWFLGLGVSSYKMQRETYTYHYDSFSVGEQRAPKEMDKGTGWYFLSHANVSVGYERRLTDHLSLIAEPYLRVPLRGVGFGKVNLFSTGVWFSARYTPVFRK